MRVFIGYDPREDEAYRVCARSLHARSSVPLDISPLEQPPHLYRRTWHENDAGQRIDDLDGKPFSTAFAFSRFLVPALTKHTGWALYCDCDFLFLGDVAALFALREERYAVQCVQHDHQPAEALKMDGRAQTRYFRKNWSSLVLWNGGHPAHAALSVDAVNTNPGAWLHGFRWLSDAQIGALPEAWNWLDGWSSPEVKAKAVHFTSGGPWMPGHRPGRYTKAWLSERDLLARDSAARSYPSIPTPPTRPAAG